MNASIRTLEVKDRPQWEALFDDYAKFYNTTVPENSKKQVWEWIFDPEEMFWCDIALNEEGEAIGFVQYQLMHRSLSGQKVCYLSDLFVDIDKRQSGTGRALIDRVMKFAKSNDIENVRWLTQDNNTTAKRLYESYIAQSDFVLYSVPVSKEN